MIELTYTQMKQNPYFGAALTKLKTCPNFGAKTAYTVTKLLGKITKEWKLADELQGKIWDKYCQKDDLGRLIQENNSLKLKEDIDAKEFEKEMKEYWEVSVAIEWHKLKLEDLEVVKNPGLTPAEMEAIEPLIYHLEEVQVS